MFNSFCRITTTHLGLRPSSNLFDGRRKKQNNLVEKMGVSVLFNNFTTADVTSAFA